MRRYLYVALIASLGTFILLRDNGRQPLDHGTITTKPRLIKVIKTISKVNDRLSGDSPIETTTGDSGRDATGADKTVEIYVPPEAEVKIISKIPDKTVEELVDIEVPTWGFVKKLGLSGGMSYSPTQGWQKHGGLDVKCFYWNRVGFGAGLSVWSSHDIDGFVFASYRLDRLDFIDNTELTYQFAPISRRHMLALRINL